MNIFYETTLRKENPGTYEDIRGKLISETLNSTKCSRCLAKLNLHTTHPPNQHSAFLTLPS